MAAFIIWLQTDKRVYRNETLRKRMRALADHLRGSRHHQDHFYPEWLEFVCERGTLRTVRVPNSSYEDLVIADMSDEDGVEMMLKWSHLIKTPRGRGRWEPLEAIR